MDNVTLGEFIEQEKRRLLNEKGALNRQMRKKNAEISALNREMLAVTAYESARSGSKTKMETRRNNVLQTIAENPGVRPRDIREYLGIESGSYEADIVAQCLSTLIKEGKIRRDEEGKYFRKQEVEQPRSRWAF